MKNIFSARTLIFIGLIVSPLFVSAAGGTELTQGITTIGGVINTLTTSVVKALAVLALTTAVTVFFFGIVQYIWGRREGDAAKTKMGNMFMVWGLLALFVMFSVWGIVRYAQKIFGIEGQNTIVIPQIEFKTGSGSNVDPFGTSPKPDTTGIPGTSGIPGTGGGGTVKGQLPPAGVGTISGSDCKGKAVGASCRTSSGRAGECWVSNETDIFDCYAVLGGTTGTTGTAGTGDTQCDFVGQACTFEGSNGTCKPINSDETLDCDTN